MTPSPQIAPPGSSSYSSDTLYVGDGTWNSEKNSFLLPNLVGLNFATMRYNGMGNRFFTMDGYHSLVKAHAILGAITFLGLVPAAIMLARFYRKSPFWALRLHIWFQILVLILTTVLFILGFFAVGPERNLSNPHHGIGVAIYILIIVQVVGGSLVHRKTKGRGAFYIPIKLVLHQWLGRTIALLGIVQVPLGLTLYGSPKELFILYAIAMLILLLTYFILSLLHQRHQAIHYDGGSSFLSGPEADVDSRGDRQKSRLGKLAAGGLGVAGLAALMRRRSSRKRPGDDDVLGTESGTSYINNEKYSDTSRKGLTNKLLTVGAVAGGIAAVKARFGNKRDDTSDAGPYRPPLGGNTSVTTDSHLEEGRPARPVTPTGASPGYARPSHPLAQPPMTPQHLRSASSLSHSYSSSSPSRRDRPHNFRDAAATGGALFAFRQMFKSRRQRKEDRRFEEDRLHRVNQDPSTGDGFSPVPDRSPRRVSSRASTDFSNSISTSNRRRPSRRHGRNSSGPPLGGVGAASAAALADRDRIRPAGADPAVEAGPSTMPPTDVPPLPPAHGSEVDSSGSELYTTTSGYPRHRHRRHHSAAAGRSDSRRRHSGRTQNTDSVGSPPVSLKVKMHNDGRHVTLRRLTEEEAANQRRDNRQAKRATVPNSTAGSGIANTSSRRRRRNSSFSSSSGGEAALSAGRRADSTAAADRRWRRTEALEREQAEAAAHQQQLQPQQLQQQSQYLQQQQPPQSYPPPPGLGPPQGQNPALASYFPPPPPIPSYNAPSGIGSITSPGTETSGATEYANNRRRRRAERAQARQAREIRAGGGGGGVEFT